VSEPSTEAKKKIGGGLRFIYLCNYIAFLFTLESTKPMGRTNFTFCVLAFSGFRAIVKLRPFVMMRSLNEYRQSGGTQN